MILTEDQTQKFLEAAKPLIEWINKNCHPHSTVLVDHISAELLEGIVVVKTEEFLKD